VQLTEEWVQLTEEWVRLTEEWVRFIPEDDLILKNGYDNDVAVSEE